MDKVPSNLILTAVLSSGITIVFSIAYIVLCIIALIYRFNCDAFDPGSIDASEIFWTTIYRVYIQDDACGHNITDDGLRDLTQSHTVFVFLAITLSFSTLTLITSIVLTALINNKEMSQYINIYVFAYICSWVGSLVVDVTFGTHLGMDYTHLTGQLTGANYGNIFLLDLVRQGSLYIMAISLKGFVVHVVNFVLILLMIIYLYDYQDKSKRDQHSIHKVGALNAFEQSRTRNEDNWTNPEMYAGPFPRGQMNNGFIEEEPRSPTRSDYYSNSRGPGSFRRSDSWSHQQAERSQPSLQPMPSSSSARPFSYLEEVRRPAPVKPPVSPAASDGWRGAWPPPPVPAPDYSPHTPRRLKSALKPNYM